MPIHVVSHCQTFTDPTPTASEFNSAALTSSACKTSVFREPVGLPQTLDVRVCSLSVAPKSVFPHTLLYFLKNFTPSSRPTWEGLRYGENRKELAPKCEDLSATSKVRCGAGEVAEKSLLFQRTEVQFLAPNSG